MKLVDLFAIPYRGYVSMITNPASGAVSKTDFFSVIAYTLASGFFAYQNIAYPFNLELWMVYLGVVGGHNVVNKIIATGRNNSSGDSDATKTSGD